MLDEIDFTRLNSDIMKKLKT